MAGLAVAIGLLTLVWVGSLLRRDASLVDRFWGFGFALLAFFYAQTAPAASPQGSRWLVVGLATVWGLRLSAYLSWRNWGHGEDYRYQEMRARGGARFPVINLVTIHWLQGLIMWVVSLILLVATRHPVPAGFLAGLGLLLFGIGFGFEALGDGQLARFKANPANRGKVLDTGVWRYTRHPNYFGDACLWWGLFCFAAAAGGWWTVVSALVMNGLLLKVSGVALLEKKLHVTKPEYRDYVARTSAFIPWPPRPARPTG